MDKDSKDRLKTQIELYASQNKRLLDIESEVKNLKRDIGMAIQRLETKINKLSGDGKDE